MNGSDRLPDGVRGSPCLRPPLSAMRQNRTGSRQPGSAGRVRSDGRRVRRALRRPAVRERYCAGTRPGRRGPKRRRRHSGEASHGLSRIAAMPSAPTVRRRGQRAWVPAPLMLPAVYRQSLATGTRDLPERREVHTVRGRARRQSGEGTSEYDAISIWVDQRQDPRRCHVLRSVVRDAGGVQARGEGVEIGLVEHHR